MSFTQNKSIKEKLIMSCIIITLIPMIILLVVFSVKMKNVEYRRRIDNAELLAEKITGYFALEMEKTEMTADNLASFLPLDKYLRTEYHSRKEQYEHYMNNIFPMLTGFSDSKDSIKVRVYHSRDIPVFSEELSNTLNEITRQYFPENPFTNGTRSVWKHVPDPVLDSCLSYFRVVRNGPCYYNVEYVVSLHMKESVFYSYLENEPVENCLILLFDQEGNILTSNERSYAGKTIRDLSFTAESPEEMLASETVTLGGEEFYLAGRGSGPISLAVMVSKDDIRKSYRSIILLFIGIGTLLLVISTLLIVYSTGKITKGVVVLMNKMRNVSRSSIHNLANDPTAEGSRDEIRQLDSAFTKMMRKIDELVDKVEDDERKLKDEVISRQQAELTNLQQQINPHYLFNTLESVRMNLVIKNDFENAEIIKLFAESFRRYINVQNKDASLFEETAFIEKYIFIQNYRLGNIIRYRLEAKETLLGNRVPKLLIQPVIENCIIHGFENKPEGGDVVLSIRKDGENLVIRVQDNGSGMSTETLAELRNHVYSQNGGVSVGLQNVYKRLKLYYGEKADLLIESTEGEGSTVTLIMPLGGQGDVQSFAGR